MQQAFDRSAVQGRALHELRRISELRGEEGLMSAVRMLDGVLDLYKDDMLRCAPEALPAIRIRALQVEQIRKTLAGQATFLPMESS